MLRQLSIAIGLEVLYRAYFDATGDLPDKMVWFVDMRKAVQYVPGAKFA